jgi:restriction system protein
MAIPTFNQMLQPLLALACHREITRRDAALAMEEHFQLTPQEREARIQTGATYVSNRSGWAMTFLTKGGLIEKVAPRTYRATSRGNRFLSEHPDTITVKDLEAIEGWKEAWRSQRREKSELLGTVADNNTTPVEALSEAISTLNADLKNRLLSTVLEQSATFFEHLVLDVLLAMGYGGSRADAAEHLGKSGDEGVDGRINQDTLGLDQIFVQAKRYAPDRPVDRKTIQAFVGSMTGQGVTKGVFITTSSFNENAREFVLRGANTKIVLIDGERLLSLMLQHHIGVRVERQLEVLELDQNYFTEDE